MYPGQQDFQIFEDSVFFAFLQNQKKMLPQRKT